MNTIIRKKRFSGSLCGLLALALAGAPGLIAQDDDEEVFELSPFSVTGEDDVGYSATTTLAGTRLKSNLRDLAGAIQIITPEFLEDTSTTGTEDLFLYTTSTEASGPDGNFGNGGAERRNPNSTRVRGLANPDRTRGYFLTDIGFDTYNTDRVAIAKGPNAILFGLGSPSGIVNNNLKQAMFRDANEIQLRYGSWGSNRVVADFNRVLVEDTLAVRIIGLNDETKYKQKPAFQDDQRLYGAIHYRATEKTTVRANFEIGSRTASRPNTSSPTSNIPSWISQGRPVTTGASGQSGFSNFGGNRNGQYIYDGPGATEPSLGFDPAPATPGPDGVNRTHFTALNIEDENASGFSNGVLTDENGWVFDYRNRSLSGLDNTQDYSWDAKNITIEHRFNENAGIELSYDDQLYESFSRDRVGNNINVDVSSFLPYLVPDNLGGLIEPTNPNVGRPYVTMTENMRKAETERDALRLTGYYDLDFAENNDDLRWLGRHVFTGVITEQRREVLNYQNNYGSVVTGEHQSVLEANRNRAYTASSWDRRGQGKRYLGSAITGVPSSGFAAQGVSNGGTPRLREFQTWMYDSQAPTLIDAHEVSNGGRGGAYRIVNSTMLVDPITSASIDRQDIDSLAVTGQSYFLNNNLVATYGWREDDASSFRSVADQTANNEVRFDTLHLSKTPDANTKASVFSWGAVAHLPREWSDNMGGIELSAHYGVSENFVPSPGRITILSQPHPDPAGETTEYGFSLGAFEGKFNVRVNWYETISFNQTDSALGSASIPNWERLFYNNVRNSLQEKEPRDPEVPRSEYETWAPDDPRLWPNNILWAETYKNPPQGMMDAFWNPTNPDPSPGGTNQVSDSPNSNVTGVSDFQSKGMEIEGVWNPTTSWTFAFNAAQQEVVKTNVLQSYREYFDLREPDWIAMGDLVARPLTYQNENPQTIYQRTRTVQWPRLLRETQQEGASSNEVREWRFNLITNYRFAEDSKLKGWSVGGAYRWQDDVGIGYRNGFATEAELGVVGVGELGISDVTQPIFGPTEQNVDLWFAHSRKILNDSIDWKIQLNIRNVLDNDDLIYTAVNPDGLPTRVRLVNPMNFRLTSTFKF